MPIELYLCGLLGLCLYFGICIIRPGWALAILALSAPFNYDIGLGGVKLAICEILLVVNAVSVLFSKPRPFPGPVFVPAMVYIVVCVFSMLSYQRPAALTSVIQMTVYLFLAVFVGRRAPLYPQHIRQCFHGVIGASIFLGCIVIATRSWEVFDLKKNALGTAFSTGFLAAFILWEQERLKRGRKAFLLVGLAVCLGGLVICASRGAWLGTLGALLLVMLYQRRFAFAGRLALLMAILIPLFWTLLPKERKLFATDVAMDSNNVAARLESIDYAMAHFKSNVWFGDGVGLRKEYDATNLVMIVLAETGLVGLAVFAGLIVSVFRHFWKSMRETGSLPPHVQALVAVSLCAFASRFIHGMVDHYWGRGMLALSWLGVGFAGALQEMGRRATEAETEDASEAENLSWHEQEDAHAVE